VADLTAIAAKLGRFIRLLASDRDGEVVAAARALTRTLKSAGADLHQLADQITQPISKRDMQRLYDAGYEAGRAAEQKTNGSDFRDVNPLPSAHLMARWCQQHNDQSNDKESKFIDGVAARTVYRAPSEKQLKWLTAIFLRLGGRAP
jgi:hypothetical protein